MKTLEEIKKEFEKLWDDNINENGSDLIWNFIESTISQTRQEVIEEIIDDIIKLSSRYWVDRYMGSPTPLIVNKGQFKRFLLEDLNKK